MNDMRKRGFFESYLTQILSRDIKIKNLYSSLDAFQNAVQTLKRIKFVQHNAIFNNTIDQHTPFEQVCNIYGCDAPENMYVELEYNNTPITTLWSFLRRLQRGRNNGEFENIVIVGEDAESIEHSFDFSSVISSRVINPVKDDNGHYDEKEVQTMLLKEIR